MPKAARVWYWWTPSKRPWRWDIRAAAVGSRESVLTYC